MKLFRTAAMAAGILLSGAIATGASAASLTITDVETGNGDLGNITVPGYGQPWTTPILFTDSKGATFVVFCDDLDHTVNVGGGQSLPYETGRVTVDGLGRALSESTSNRMGQLAEIGIVDYDHHNENGAIAAQAAIWDIEYGVDVTSTDPVLSALIADDLNVKDNMKGFAFGLISDDGHQSQLTGGVPEPATWGMMLVGFGGLGVAMRAARRRRAATA